MINTLDSANSMGFSPQKPYKPRKLRIPFKKKGSRRRPVTCIVGLKSSNGIALISDRRVTTTTDSEARDRTKLFTVWHDHLALAGSGFTFLTDYFKEDIDKIEKVNSFSEMAKRLEDIAGKLYQRYSSRLKKEGYNYDFEVLFIGLEEITKGQPRMRFFERNGISEEINDFKLLGSGAPYALPFVKTIYNENLSTNQLWRTGYYAISTVINLELDTGVGGLPDVIVLEENKSPHFLKDEDMYEGGYAIDAFDNNWPDLNKWLIPKIALNTDDMTTLENQYGYDDESFKELVKTTRKKIHLK